MTPKRLLIGAAASVLALLIMLAFCQDRADAGPVYGACVTDTGMIRITVEGLDPSGANWVIVTGANGTTYRITTATNPLDVPGTTTYTALWHNGGGAVWPTDNPHIINAGQACQQPTPTTMPPPTTSAPTTSTVATTTPPVPTAPPTTVDVPTIPPSTPRDSIPPVTLPPTGLPPVAGYGALIGFAVLGLGLVLMWAVRVSRRNHAARAWFLGQVQ
jgi:hypothetical protein